MENHIKYKLDKEDLGHIDLPISYDSVTICNELNNPSENCSLQLVFEDESYIEVMTDSYQILRTLGMHFYEYNGMTYFSEFPQKNGYNTDCMSLDEYELTELDFIDYLVEEGIIFEESYLKPVLKTLNKTFTNETIK